MSWKSLGADWLTSTWDQNTALYVMSPAMAVIEEVTAAWVLDLLRLPADASVGFTTGDTMANFTGIAAGRHAVLRRVGWDVEEHGLQGAPAIRVIAGADVHVSALRRKLGDYGDRIVTIRGVGYKFSEYDA